MMENDLVDTVLKWWDEHWGDAVNNGDGDSQLIYDNPPEFVEMAQNMRRNIGMKLTLTYRELDDYKYQVKEYFKIQTGLKGADADTEYVSLSPDGQLRTKEYYAWNGSNWSSDKHAMIPSLVHDALCQLMRLGLLNRTVFGKPADALYRDLYFAEAMASVTKHRWYWEKRHKFHANLRYRMLRLFGKSATYPEKKPRGQIKSVTIEYVGSESSSAVR